MKAAFHTLGCKVNQYETEAIKEAFVSRGAEITDEDDPADIYVINTCSVTGIADRKSRQFIRRSRRLNPDAVVVVTGCYAQTAPEELESMPEVDLIIGNSLKTEIADRALELYKRRNGKGFADGSEDIVRSHVLSYDELREFENMGIVTSGESFMCRAYIKIEEGCNRFCSYCLIPYARGRVRSRRPDEILEEARALVDSGYKEIVLTGINTALYGTEPEFEFERLPGEEGLSGLEAVLKRLDAMEGDFRIRLSSLEPTVVSKDDVLKLLGYKRLCHHLHLSVQSGSDSVLRSMNRRYTRSEYLEIVKAIREFDPLYGITTDIIAGFPGETESDFEDSLDITERSEFGKVHVFRYSPRRGTPGESMPDAVPGDVKNERAGRLAELADEVALRFIEKYEGRRERVLIEEINDGYAEGYTGSYIKVYIECGDGAAPEPGEFCEAVMGRPFRDGCRASLADRG